VTWAKPDFSTFYYFATSMATGIAMVLPIVPVMKIGRRFFILMSLIAVVLISLATLVSGLAINYLHVAFGGFLIAYNVTIPPQTGADRSPRREALEGGPQPGWSLLSRALLLVAAACGVLALVLDALHFPVSLEGRIPQGPWLTATFLGSAVLLGSSLTSMVLGHWYLVARKLSFTPLARIVGVFLVALVARTACDGVSVWAQADRWETIVARSGWAGFIIDPGVFLIARAVFGLLAPMALGYMAWKCIGIRSNQSATGILYVTLAFVLIGEIIAAYFLTSQGLVI
jgi:hypothetical protein